MLTSSPEDTMHLQQRIQKATAEVSYNIFSLSRGEISVSHAGVCSGSSSLCIAVIAYKPGTRNIIFLTKILDEMLFEWAFLTLPHKCEQILIPLFATLAELTDILCLLHFYRERSTWWFNFQSRVYADCRHHCLSSIFCNDIYFWPEVASSCYVSQAS